MKKIVLLSTLALVLASPWAGADEAVRSAQAALQANGFYTGPVDGELSAATTAALRRYQIRNGLEPSGKLDAATTAALQHGSPGTQQAATRPSATPASFAWPPAPVTPVPAAPASVDPRYLGQFAKTPFENAAPEVQAATVRKAQAQLAARRFYAGALDGIPGHGFEEALLRYQAARQLPRTGRLDIDTLAAMHLLPIAKLKRPRVEPAPYVPKVPATPPGAVRGVQVD